jgi:hypothetical protein
MAMLGLAWLGLAVLVGGLSSPLVAQEAIREAIAGLESQTAPWQASLSEVEIRLLDGEAVRDRLIAIQKSALVLAERREPIPLDSVVRVSWMDAAASRVAWPSCVVFAGGDVLSMRPVSSNADAMTLTWNSYSAWPRFAAPLEALRGLVLNAPFEVEGAGRLITLIESHAGNEDRVWLNNGDTLQGEFESLDADRVHLQTSVGPRSISRSNVVAIAFNPELATAPPVEKRRATLTLTDGSRCLLNEFQIGSDGLLQARLSAGPEVAITPTATASLHPHSARVRHLSDLEPRRFDFTPYTTLTWPWKRDRNSSSQLMWMRGVAYPKGLGLHSRSELEFDLGGNFKRFLGTAGIDDDTRSRGHAVVTVLVDGKSVWTGDVAGASSPVAIPAVDLARKKSLVIRVDYGRGADVLDHVNLVDAVLVK